MNSTSETLFNSCLKKLEANLVILSDKPEDTIESTLRALWLVASAQSVSSQKAIDIDLPDLNDSQKTNLCEMIEKRLSGIPLAHITGVQEFMGIDIQVNENALIPRKETELLGYAALEKVNDAVETQGSALVFDVCTGCGNLALAITSHQPKIKLYAMDLSDDAILLAKNNQQQLGIDERVEFFAGDLLEPVKNMQLEGKVDVIICNPPYITSGKLNDMPEEIIKFEPEMAFNGGALGIKIINKLCVESLEYLKPGGWLVFELGLGQGAAILKRQQKKNIYSSFGSVNDENGNIRVIILQK